MNPAAVGGLLQGGASVLGALGLGGSKFKSWHGREQIRQTIRQAELMPAAVRKGAEEAGFNPLTVLGQTSIGGAAAGGTVTAPKLASLEMITNGLKGISDEFTGAASQERAQRELQLDLARIELDKAKALGGVGIAPQPAGAYGGPQIGKGANRPVPISTKNTNPIASGRVKEVAPLSNSSGVFELENDLTMGPLTIPGDGEPWGLDELGTAAVVGVPQMFRNGYRKYRDAWGKGRTNVVPLRAPKLGNGPSVINHGDTRRWRN